MGAVAPILLVGASNDSAQVDHGNAAGGVKTNSAAIATNMTFSPDGQVAPGVTRWVDRSGGIPIGYPTITMSLRRPSKTSKLFKIVYRISLPTLEQTSASTMTGIQPAPTVAYTCVANLEVTVSERSTLAERTRLLNTMLTSLVATVGASDGAPVDNTGTPFRSAVANLEDVY